MDNLNKQEAEPQAKFHYDLIRDDEDAIIDKLNVNLGFYSFRKVKRVKGQEIFYDTPNDLLSSAGVVLSKQFEEKGTAFKVRKISSLPSEMKRPSRKFELAECGAKQAPKDFALQVSTAINNSFSNIFTIDLAEVVKKTIPKIQITIKGNLYEIHGGTGFKASMMFETVTYKDLIGRKKVKRNGVTINFPTDERYESDKQAILDGVQRFCKGMIPYRESRFEIATRVLFPKHQQKLGLKNLRGKKKEKPKEEEESKEEA